MPTLDAALDQALGKHVSNPVITIDYSQKILVLPQDFGKAGVRGDDNGRRIYFQMPNQMDEIAPWSEHCYVEIQYKNAQGETGRYLVSGSELTNHDQNEYICSFPIPATLAKYEGEAEIQLCIRTVDGSKEWHISPVKILIGPFFDCEVITEEDPKYDIVAELMAKVTRLEGIITEDETLTLSDYLTKAEAASTYMTTAAADRLSYSAATAYYGAQSINPLFENECLIVTYADYSQYEYVVTVGSQSKTLTGTGEVSTLRVTRFNTVEQGAADCLLVEAGDQKALFKGLPSALSIRLPERTTSYILTK